MKLWKFRVVIICRVIEMASLKISFFWHKYMQKSRHFSSCQARGNFVLSKYSVYEKFCWTNLKIPNNLSFHLGTTWHPNCTLFSDLVFSLEKETFTLSVSPMLHSTLWLRKGCLLSIKHDIVGQYVSNLANYWTGFFFSRKNRINFLKF